MHNNTKISGNYNSGNHNAIFVPSGGGVNVSGIFIMHGGTITDNVAYCYGGGVYVSDTGTFTMYEGTINGNSITGTTYFNCGGGIYINGTFIMHDGKVRENAAEIGGGVYLNQGVFSMHGGTINGNTAKFNNHERTGRGGGVFINTGVFTKTCSHNNQSSGIIYGIDADEVSLRNAARNNTSGHAIFSGIPELSQIPSRSRNATAWETDHIDTTTGRGLSASGNPPFGQ